MNSPSTSAFRRSGSLIQRKQDEWAKQKADETNSEWFPFGAPGGGSPNRKFESKTYPATASDGTDPGRPLATSTYNDIQQNASTSNPPGRPFASAEPEKSTEARTGLRTTSTAVVMEDPHVASTSQPPSGLIFPQMMPYQVPISYGPYSYPGPQAMVGENPQAQQQHHSNPNFHFQQQPLQYPNWGYPPYAYPPYAVIPPNAIPISTTNADGSPMCPISIAEQLSTVPGVWGMPSGQQSGSARYGIPIAPPFPMTASMVGSISSESNGSGHNFNTARSISESHDTQRERVAVRDEECRYSHVQEPFQGQISTTRHVDAAPSTGQSEAPTTTRPRQSDVYEIQIAERRRLEAQERERERQEEERRRHEREIAEQRRENEERMRQQAEKNRLEEEQRRVKQFVEAKQRAEHEAQLMKKAIVYRHVLEAAVDGDEQQEAERRLLGVDGETGDRLLKEISHFERQKKLDWQEIERNAPPKTKKAPRSTSVPSRSRTGSSGGGNENEQVEKESPAQSTREENPDNRPIRPSPEYVQFERFARGRTSVRVTRQELAENGRSRVTTSSTSNEGNPKKPLANNRTNVDIPKSTKPTVDPRKPSTPILNPVKSNISPGLTRSTSLRGKETESSAALLFSPIRTRKSLRMRPTNESPLQTMARGSIESNEETSSGSVSPDNHQLHKSSSPPSSTENIEPKSDAMHTPDLKEYKTRSRSALETPSYYLNGRTSPLASSTLAKRLQQKGCGTHGEDILSPDVRRKAEASFSRSPSMASVYNSLSNLSKLRGSCMNLSSTERGSSTNLSKFQSMTSASRQSFSLKKTDERQKALLENLARLRAKLHSSQNFSPRPLTSSRGYTAPVDRPLPPTPVITLSPSN